MTLTDTISQKNVKAMVQAFNIDMSQEVEENNGQVHNKFVEMIEQSEYSAQFSADVFYADFDGNIEYKVLDATVDLYTDEDNFIRIPGNQFETLINA